MRDESKEMLERVPGIFEVSLTSEAGSGANPIHIYLIPGREGKRSLMVDAGFGEQQCLDRMEPVLEKLGISYDMLDVFLTHKHHDHCGLASTYARKGARLFMNPAEERHHYDCLYYRKSKDALEEQVKVLHTAGVTPEKTPGIWDKFMEVNDRVEMREESWTWVIKDYPYMPVFEGKTFCYGEYVFRAFALKGHTCGQMGLYDEEHRIAFTADQILNGIVPIVGTTHVDEHILEGYFESLEQLKNRFSGYLILPSHLGPIRDLTGVVERIATAYLDKLDLMVHILQNKKREMTVQEIAFEAYGIRRDPANDREFIKVKMTMSKTFSCLEYLFARELVTRVERDGILYWQVKNAQ